MKFPLPFVAFVALAAGIPVVVKLKGGREVPVPPPVLKATTRSAEKEHPSAVSPPTDPRDAVVEGAASDLAQALEIAAGIGEDQPRGEALGFVLAQMAMSDPDAVFGWFGSSGEDAETVVVVERAVLPALAEQDPERVARWIAGGRVSPGNRASAVVTTVQRWAQRDPAAASEWVAGFGDDRLLRAAMEPLISVWSSGDRSAPAAWIGDLPAGVARDEACAAYAASIAVRDPDEAERWAAEIASPKLLADTRRRIGRE